MNLEEVCSEIVSGCKASGLNLLAIDFDYTIVDIHTSGRWSGTLEELASSIRPFFRILIPTAIDQGLQVAVVTFSPQVNIIAAVLKLVFTDAVASKIPIRGNDNSWEYAGRGSQDGKQGHMASAAEEISQKNNVVVTRATTVLIDDDRNNIEVAYRNEVRAIWLNPDDPDASIRNFRELAAKGLRVR